MAVGEIPSLAEESIGKAHVVLECTQTYSPEKQHLKGHNHIVGSEGSDGVGQEPSKWHCSLSDPSPTNSATMQPKGLDTLANP